MVVRGVDMDLVLAKRLLKDGLQQVFLCDQFTKENLAGTIASFGPNVNWTPEHMDDRIRFHLSPALNVRVRPLIWAVVDKIDLMEDGQAFAIGTALGFTERRKIMLTLGEPENE